MATHSCCGSCYRGLICFGRILQPFILLAMRLFWGYLFVVFGAAKLGHISETAKSFASLNIPIPHFMAYLVGLTEVVGGFLLIIGLGSRLAALALCIVTIVAYATAHVEAFHQLAADPQILIKQPPFNFLLTSLLVLAFGPGLFSIDALIKRSCCHSCETPPPEGAEPLDK